jgi:antitoxin Phd
METRCGRLFQQVISIATHRAKHYRGTFYFFREPQTVRFSSYSTPTMQAEMRSSALGRTGNERKFSMSVAPNVASSRSKSARMSFSSRGRLRGCRSFSYQYVVAMQMLQALQHRLFDLVFEDEAGHGQCAGVMVISSQSGQNLTEGVMHDEWQLQEAKNNLSQLIKEAAGGDAQVVTVHGKPTAVVLSAEEYARLTRPKRGKLSAALLRPDIAADDLDTSRSRDTGRDTGL